MNGGGAADSVGGSGRRWRRGAFLPHPPSPAGRGFLFLPPSVIPAAVRYSRRRPVIPAAVPSFPSTLPSFLPPSRHCPSLSRHSHPLPRYSRRHPDIARRCPVIPVAVPSFPPPYRHSRPLYRHSCRCPVIPVRFTAIPAPVPSFPRKREATPRLLRWRELGESGLRICPYNRL